MGRSTFLWTILLCSVQACAPAINYRDPSAPVFVAQPPHTAASTRRPLRIVTYNIKFGKEIDRAIDLLSRPAPFHDPDVLVLQEMDLDGVARIASALGLGYVYAPSARHPASSRDFGVAVLSPWPMTDAGKIELPHQHQFRRLQRAAVSVTVAAPIGPLRVYGVHLETPFGATDDERRDQAEAVLADAERWTGPAIVAGDFNGNGGVQAVVRAGFAWVTRRVGHTAGPFTLDHIFARGLCPAGAAPAGTGPRAREVSDHRLVWALVGACSG